MLSVALIAGLLLPAAHGGGLTDLKKWQDEFFPGYWVNFEIQDRDNEVHALQVGQLIVHRGWDTGLALSLVGSAILGENDPDNLGLATPRIGGVFPERIEALADFRLWGDELDYFSVGTGIATPLQNDPVLKDSEKATWLLPINVRGRLDWSAIATELRFRDYATFPRLKNAGGTNFYQDSTNYLSLEVSLLAYPQFLEQQASPFVQYTELFPRNVDVNFEKNDAAFLSFASKVVRKRFFSFGVQFTPFKKFIITLQADTFQFCDVGSDARWRATGALRWVF